MVYTSSLFLPTVNISHFGVLCIDNVQEKVVSKYKILCIIFKVLKLQAPRQYTLDNIQLGNRRELEITYFY